jgi:hypothetical protein
VGVFPGIYRTLGQMPPTGVLNVWMALPSYGGSWAPHWERQLLGDLGRNAPDVLVLDDFTMHRVPDGHGLRQMLGDFRMFAKSGSFTLWVRRGSRVEERLLANDNRPG